jgi:hypothetical protein
MTLILREVPHSDTSPCTASRTGEGQVLAALPED